MQVTILNTFYCATEWFPSTFGEYIDSHFQIFTLCTLTSTVQLPFPCTFSPIQKINYGDKQFWRLRQNFDLEIYLRIRANLIQFLDTEMKSTWWKQGKVYSFLFIERPNLPSFASRSEITLKTTSQKHTSWMLHYLIATWASSSILKDLW